MSHRLLILSLVTLAFVACGTDATPPGRSPSNVRLPVEKPLPSPIPATPRARRTDEAGNLKAAADRMFGYAIPVGSHPIRRSKVGTTLALETPIERVVRFYWDQNYTVTQLKGAYRVEPSNSGDSSDAGRMKLFLHTARGGRVELRFVVLK